MIDKIMLLVNVILTIMSAVGAWRSFNYYRKSKYLLTVTELNKALIKLESLIKKLPELLIISQQISPGYLRRGVNNENKLCEVGKDLIICYDEILCVLPLEAKQEVDSAVEKANFNLRQYFNTIVNGEAMKDEKLNMEEFTKCQNLLSELHSCLKRHIENNEEKLK